MRYLSVCSGIEAATVAWHGLGWSPAAFSEIEAFPSAVLAHHYPEVRNLGDMTRYQEWDIEPIDLLVGGTPCQSFSVAGLRKGLADPRGNLALVYLGIADRFKPRWIVWENVPGVLSSGGGRDFGSFLGALGELGYGFSYRVLDAQYYGVAQRRRRVFVVGYLGDWRRAAAVLFERESLSRNPAPRRKTRKVAPTIPSRSTGGGGLGTDFDCDGGLVPAVAGSLDTECGGGKLTHQSVQNGHLIGTITARMFNALGPRDVEEGALLPVSVDVLNHSVSDIAHTLSARNDMQTGAVLAFDWQSGGDMRGMDLKPTAMLQRSQTPAVTTYMQVRRLTSEECEALQGFPRSYTAIPWRKQPAEKCPDGPRYKALGNSMAVPVMKWIGERIDRVESAVEAA